MRIKEGEIYRNYKGNDYEIIAVATHTENLKTYITYKSLVDGRSWVRPAKMFRGVVTVNGKKVKRFVRKGKNKDV